MKFYTFLSLLLIVNLSLSSSCKKSGTAEPGEVAATLSDYTGFDGCSWIIVLENGEVKEPVNLGSFEFELEEGKKIWVEYTVLDNAISICMVGEVVRVESIRER